MGTGPVFGRP